MFGLCFHFIERWTRPAVLLLSLAAAVGGRERLVCANPPPPLSSQIADSPEPLVPHTNPDALSEPISDWETPLFASPAGEGDEQPVFVEQPLWLEPLPPDADEPATAPTTNGLNDSSRAPLRARLSWLPSSTLKNGPGNVSLNTEQLEVAFPLRFESDGIWLGMVGLQSLEVAMSNVPASIAAPLPNRFWDIELGVMRIKKWDGGNQSGAMVRVGSPSDQPYAALRDVTVSCLAFLQVPRGEQDAWEFSVFYSPTGQVIFPLPGVAYRWRPSDRFQAQIGVPASFTYRPTDDWTFRGVYRPLNQVQLEALRHWGPLWDGFARFDTISTAFFQADRVEDRERTYFFDQRLSLGVRRRFVRGWSLEASAAYAFDRKIFDAVNFSGDRTNVMSLDATVGGGVMAVWER